jgi:hypothetical protein
MTIARWTASLVFVMATGCTGPKSGELQEELSSTKPAVWTFATTEYCGDVCPPLPGGQPDTMCTCLAPQTACPSNPAGQACSPVAATCWVKSPIHHVTEYSCDPPPMYYRIANAKSGLCLGVANANNGTAVAQGICSGTATQDWWVENAASATSRIINRSTGKCLDIVANLAVQNPCDARASELFQPESSTRNTMLIRTNASSLASCIDVPNALMTPVQVQHFGCKNPAASPTWFGGLQDLSNQLWVFLPNS